MFARLEGPSLNMRHLQEYIAFARTLNFSSAAREVYLSQSTLSTHMQKLEAAVGVPLINHGVKPSLTPSGKLFLEYAERIVCLCLDSVNAVRDYSSSALSLTVEEPLPASRLFYAIARSRDYFADTYPQARLSLHSLAGCASADAIREGHVEVAQIVDANPWDSDAFARRCRSQGLEALPVAAEPPIVWMQADHRLASLETVSLQDLATTPILLPADVRYDEWRGVIKAWFASADVTPVLNLQVTGTRTEFYMTRPNERVFLLPEPETTTKVLLGTHGLVPRRLRNVGCYYVSLAYSPDSKNPLLPLFVDFMREELGRLPEGKTREGAL